MKNLEDLWKRIKEYAKAEDDFDRCYALRDAYACLDVALKVFLPKKEAFPTMKGVENFLNLNNPSNFPDLAKLEKAYKFRNEATHELEVPSPEITEEAVEVIHKAWRCMRRSFVNRSNAARIAKEFLNKKSCKEGKVTNVFLFGSLTRHEYDPKGYEPQDIDLLLFDLGNRSYLNFGYSDPFLFDLLSDDSDPSESDLSSGDNRAKKCGWLQLIYVDGSRFGVDRKYTLSLVKKQHDPLFFLNLSDGLMEFSLKDDKWVSQMPQVFQRLAYLRRQLENEYMLESQ